MIWEGKLTGDVATYLWDKKKFYGFCFRDGGETLEVFGENGSKIYKIGDEIE